MNFAHGHLLSQRSCDNEVRARSEDLLMEGIRRNRGSGELACTSIDLAFLGGWEAENQNISLWGQGARGAWARFLKFGL